jgi:hypothetical protein
MATVRFSTALVNEVIRAAKDKMEPAVKRAEDTRPDHSWGERIHNLMFTEEMRFVRSLPREWFKQIEDIRISTSVYGSDDFSMTFKLSSPLPWPDEVRITEYYQPVKSYFYNTGTSGAVHLKNHELWSEFYQEAVAYIDRVRDARARQNEFVDMVKQVVHTYTTLSPALKAWPALWELIPEDAKERHREVKERTKKDTTLDVDINRLTAMAAAAKFGV